MIEVNSICLGAGDMALAAQAWGPECRSQYPCEKLGTALHVLIAPVLGGDLGQEVRKTTGAHWLKTQQLWVQ